MLPNLKITDAQGKERMIVWGLDGRILQDGVWIYDINPGSDPKGNAAIGRTNNKKQKEYWFKDDPNGKETTVALDQTKTERSWFTSGIMSGKERKETTTFNNRIIDQNSWKYGEEGRLIAKNSSSSKIIYKYIEQNKIGLYRDEKMLQEFETTKKGYNSWKIYFHDGCGVEILVDSEKRIIKLEKI